MDAAHTFSFVLAFLCLFSGFALSFVKMSVARQRRIYWRCAALGAVAGFFCGYPGVGRGLEGAGFFLAAMVFMAMRYSPYLKIGGKVYAFSATDRHARDEDVPSTFQENLAGVADLIQRKYGDPDIPDTTGRNVTEALEAFNRRFGGKDPTVIKEGNASDAAAPTVSEPDPAPERVFIAVPDRGGMSPRPVNFLFGLALAAGGALMAINPPPPFRNPHMITATGVLCAALGVYLIVKALRNPELSAAAIAQHTTLSAGSARPHRHAAPASIADSARQSAPLVAIFLAGAGLLWWGVAAGLWSVVGLGVVLLSPTLVVLAATAVARFR